MASAKASITSSSAVPGWSRLKIECTKARSIGRRFFDWYSGSCLRAVGERRRAFTGPDHGVERKPADQLGMALREQCGAQRARRNAVDQERLLAAQLLDIGRGRKAIVGALRNRRVVVAVLGRAAVAFHVDAPGVEAAAGRNNPSPRNWAGRAPADRRSAATPSTSRARTGWCPRALTDRRHISPTGTAARRRPWWSNAPRRGWRRWAVTGLFIVAPCRQFSRPPWNPAPARFAAGIGLITIISRLLHLASFARPNKSAIEAGREPWLCLRHPGSVEPWSSSLWHVLRLPWPSRTSPPTSSAGRQLTIAIASSSGGGYDSYGRLVARHIVKHIPGNPGSVVTNMTGAGGHLVGRYVSEVAPRDGTWIA